MEDRDPASSHALVSRDVVSDIVSRRDAALAAFQSAVEQLQDAHQAVAGARELAETACQGTSGGYNERRNAALRGVLGRIPADIVETFRQDLDSRCWYALRNLSGLVDLMDASAKRKWDETHSARDIPEITYDNVMATILGFREDAQLHWQRGVARVFSDLDPRFKSHDAFKVGKVGGGGYAGRIILTHVFSYVGTLDTDLGAKILDMERIFARLDDRQRIDGPDGDPIVSLTAAMKRDRDESGSWGPRRSTTRSTYFLIRTYKNGNAHLWFTRPDLVDKVNLVLADYYGAVLPDAYPSAASAADFEATAEGPSAALVRTNLGFYPSDDTVAAHLLKGLSLDFWMRDEGAVNQWGRPNGGRSGKNCAGVPILALEPGAGLGDLVRPLAQLRVPTVAVELHPDRFARIERQAAAWPAGRITPVRANFLAMRPDPVYTHVVMNPPFHGTHWMDHIRHAWEFLAPGGELRSVAPITAKTSAGAKHEAFREWLRSVRALCHQTRCTFDDLPARSFAHANTNVNTCVISITKGAE